MPNLIEIFRGGTHTDMRGTTLAFGESEIVDIAAAYDPALSEAPIVIGHPRTDAPAYGWVKSLSARGDRLYAEPDQVDAAFAELVESGRYKKVSACFYRPAAPANPARTTCGTSAFSGRSRPPSRGLPRWSSPKAPRTICFSWSSPTMNP